MLSNAFPNINTPSKSPLEKSWLIITHLECNIHHISLITTVPHRLCHVDVGVLIRDGDIIGLAWAILPALANIGLAMPIRRINGMATLMARAPRSILLVAGLIDTVYV